MIVATGHVSERPFARTLYAIGSRRHSGELSLFEAGRRYILAWEDGKVVAAESAAPTDTAGRIAIAAGLVTSTQVAQSLQVMAQRPGVSQLDILIELAKLGPDHVAALRRRLLAHRAARAFALADARYELSDQRTVPNEVTPPLDVRWLIQFGLRAHYSEERLNRELVSLAGRPIRLADDAVEATGFFGFSEGDQSIVGILRQRVLTADELIETLDGIDRRTILSLIYALAACDCLTIGHPTTEPVANAIPSADGTQPGPGRILRVAATVPPRAPLTAAAIGAQNRVRRLTGQPPLSGEATRPRGSSISSGPRPQVTLEPPIRQVGTTIPPTAKASGNPLPVGLQTSQPLDVALPSTAPSQPPSRPQQPPIVVVQASTRTASASSQPAPAPGTSPPAAPTNSRPHTTGNPRAAEDSAEIRELVRTKIREVDSDASHFALLGVGNQATVDEIRTAYFALAKRLHPDRLRAVGITDQASDAQRLFAAINQAFTVLSDATKRNQYITLLASGGAEAARRAEQQAEELASKLFRAEDAFRKGEMALRRNQFEQARTMFAEAAELAPDEAEHQAMLAWATWCASENKETLYAEVQRKFNHAITISPRCLPAHFYRAMVAKQAGKDAVAIEGFKRVLELRSSHAEADLELRLLESRRAKQKEGGGGLFDKLKKK